MRLSIENLAQHRFRQNVVDFRRLLQRVDKRFAASRVRDCLINQIVGFLSESVLSEYFKNLSRCVPYR